MPSYTRGKPREKITFALMFNAPINIYYNWSAKDLANLAGVTSNDLTTDLGHVYSVANSSIVIVAAKSPKPPTVRKVIKKNPGPSEQGSVSTFCANGNLNSAAAKGWKLSKVGRTSSFRKDARTTTALAGISNGSVYASPMNTADYNEYNVQLGLIDPATINTANERNVIVSGATRPRAAHAFKVLASGATVSGFYSPNAPILENGWTPDSPEIL